jgi:hypothetical protein
MFAALESLFRACFCGVNDVEQQDSPARPVEVSIPLSP